MEKVFILLVFVFEWGGEPVGDPVEFSSFWECNKVSTEINRHSMFYHGHRERLKAFCVAKKVKSSQKAQPE